MSGDSSLPGAPVTTSDGLGGCRSCQVFVGVAGWSYPDWDGYVYTSRTSDHLTYVSQFVDCIEINSTFYRPPSRPTVLSWLEKTKYKPGFFFTAKLHRDFTHQGIVDQKMVDQFKVGFEPLLGEGRLRFLLAQFRYDFAYSAQTKAFLDRIVSGFRDSFAIAVEVRHRSWQLSEALEFLAGLGVTVCNLDYPVSRQSFQLRCCTIGQDGYFRLHGRNAAMWFSKAGRDQTYDYYYNRAELEGIRQRILELGKALQSLTVIMNNHYRGSELANAIELKFLLTGNRQLAPASLIKAYPGLTEVADGDGNMG